MRFIDHSPSDVALHTWQADVEARLQEASAVGEAQVHFGINRQVSRKSDLPFAGRKPHRAFEAGRPTSGEQLLRIGADAAVPGVESLTSRRPSELRDTPFSRPPLVWVLAVYTTYPSWGVVRSFSSWVMVLSGLFSCFSWRQRPSINSRQFRRQLRQRPVALPVADCARRRP